MQRNGKIAIVVGTIIVMALTCGVYYFTQSKNTVNNLNGKEDTIVQNDSESNSNDTTINEESSSKEEQNSNSSTNDNAGSNIGSSSSTSGQVNRPNQDTSEKPNEKPGALEDSSEIEKPENQEEPEKPEEPENPGEEEKPEEPEVPEETIGDLEIAKDDLVDGVLTISNKSFNNVSIDSSVVNGKIILDNVEIKEKLILKDGAKYQVQLKNSSVPNVKLESKELGRYRNVSLDVNKNINGPTLHLENVKEINNVDINGNISILGDGSIDNVNIQNGTLVLEASTKNLNIDKNSNNADITINKTVSEVNDNGSNTILGVNSNVERVNSNGYKSSIYIKDGAMVGQAIINGDSSKVMGNGKVNSVKVNGNNAGIYTEIPKENIIINEGVNNTFIGREEKYEISNITLKQQGVIEFTLNEATSRAITLSELSIICHGGNTMSVLNVSTKDNKTYTLNTSYFKDNTYELYLTLPNGKIISKEFVYSYNHPTASKVVASRTSENEGILDVYGVDEGGYLYYKVEKKSLFSFFRNKSVDNIKEDGIKVPITTEYNEIAISNLEENSEYDVYYVMEGYDGRTSPVYGPIKLGKYDESQVDSEYKLDYAEEVVANRFVFTFNKPVKGELKLEDFSIICPSESALTTKGAKFIVSSDKQTYTIIVPDNYGHKDNKYTVKVNMPDGSVVEGSFRSHFNPPVIAGDSIDHYSKNKIKFSFNSDEYGTLYYGVYEWNNSVYAGESTTPMAEDVLSGKIKGTEAKLNSGYNELDIDLSGYNLTNKSRLWVLFVDFDGNYRRGFVDHFKIPEFKGEPDNGGEEDKSSLDIINLEVSEGWSGTMLNLTFNEDLKYTFGQNEIKLQSLSGANLPGKINMSVSFPWDKLNYASVEFNRVYLSAGDYRITINTYDSKDRPVKIVKEFTVE
ncbi:hypothetical protein [Clostridium paraputrificum]|uniref:Uncharacterized protein n=1 Tax=Clostridium paraputrificum TaxID=29363 RepID=A0A6N3GQ31_9CLOT